MRLLPLLLLTLFLAACGSAQELTGIPASSGQGEGTASAETGAESEDPLDESELKPPAVLLVSRGEVQEAVQGSYCVDYVDEASGQGQGLCADAALPTFPAEVTAVARGDRVTFVLREAVARRDSTITIRPLGCSEETTDELRFPPGEGERRWQVDLEPGGYQLDVFARFKATDGRSGDVSASLGLTVAGPKENDALGVVAVKRAMQVCAFTG